ncbi:MAG: hypothetical protein QG614_283 [Patescibacteria group bacterium]|nr:hypothetical protein [Patescibacteria group bacterium]
MLIVRVGDNFKKRNELNHKYGEYFSKVDLYLRSDGIFGLKQYLGEDIFGGKLVIKMENWNNEETRSFLYKYLEDIKNSQNIFVIDELDMLDATFKKLSSFAAFSFDCKEEKVKDSAFHLADLIIRKNKKDAWIEYHRLLKMGEPVESIIGALNYKLKFVYDNNKEKVFGDNLIFLAKSHDSEGDAVIELERFILNL